MDKLLNCPFCGSENVGMFFAGEPSESYAVECIDCEANIPYKETEQEAIDSWNRRAE